MPRTHNSSIWIALGFLRSATNPNHFTQWMFMNFKAKLVDVFDIHYPIIYTFTDVCLISKPSWHYMFHIPNILILPSLLPYILILPCQDLHGLKRKPGAIRNLETAVISTGWRTWINWCEKARRWIQAASQNCLSWVFFMFPKKNGDLHYETALYKPSEAFGTYLPGESMSIWIGDAPSFSDKPEKLSKCMVEARIIWIFIHQLQ